MRSVDSGRTGNRVWRDEDPGPGEILRDVDPSVSRERGCADVVSRRGNSRVEIELPAIVSNVVVIAE
jgi:hypothetical protein